MRNTFIVIQLRIIVKEKDFDLFKWDFTTFPIKTVRLDELIIFSRLNIWFWWVFFQSHVSTMEMKPVLKKIFQEHLLSLHQQLQAAQI